MPGGGRKVPRTVRTNIPAPVLPLIPSPSEISSKYAPLGATVPTLPGFRRTIALTHFPFPNTPVDSDLFFEGLMLIFTVTAAGLQFLHLYRSVWWLPHSYTKQAMNFYLIDMNLVIFVMIILSRRFIYISGCKVIGLLVPGNCSEVFCVCFRVFLFGLITGTLSCCVYYIFQTHPIVNIFYLLYPTSMYLILFGFSVSPFFELINWNPNILPPLHACSVNPTETRVEVEKLKVNFNNRMKQILFNSVINAYYAGFIPCCFAQSFLYYDVYWATQHVVFIFLSCFTSYAIHIFPLRYCDTLHRSALHLGSWTKVESRSLMPAAYMWHGDMLWPFGVLVRHGRDVYRAQAESNAAEPGNPMYSRFYSIFKNPSTALSGLLALHIFLVLFQLALLVRSSLWYHILSLTLLLFYNYYTLFKIGRDYLVCLKIYKTEQMMHDKIIVN